MIDAAKVSRFPQLYKENNLANGSVLLGTVFWLNYKLNVRSEEGIEL